jgi:hypothetical protein
MLPLLLPHSEGGEEPVSWVLHEAGLAHWLALLIQGNSKLGWGDAGRMIRFPWAQVQYQ